MRTSTLNNHRISYALLQAGGGTPVAEVCRKMGISEAKLLQWEMIYGGATRSEIRRMRTLETQNRRLRKQVADLTLDKKMLTAMVKQAS
jgi:putative transposase